MSGLLDQKGEMRRGRDGYILSLLHRPPVFLKPSEKKAASALRTARCTGQGTAALIPLSGDLVLQETEDK